MTAFLMIVLTTIFPMSNAHAEKDIMYTTYTVDPQRNMVIRCSLLKVKNENVIICTEKLIKEIK